MLHWKITKQKTIPLVQHFFVKAYAIQLEIFQDARKKPKRVQIVFTVMQRKNK